MPHNGTIYGVEQFKDFMKKSESSLLPERYQALHAAQHGLSWFSLQMNDQDFYGTTAVKTDDLQVFSFRVPMDVLMWNGEDWEDIPAALLVGIEKDGSIAFIRIFTSYLAYEAEQKPSEAEFLWARRYTQAPFTHNTKSDIFPMLFEGTNLPTDICGLIASAATNEDHVLESVLMKLQKFHTNWFAGDIPKTDENYKALDTYNTDFVSCDHSGGFWSYKYAKKRYWTLYGQEQQGVYQYGIRGLKLLRTWESGLCIAKFDLATTRKFQVTALGIFKIDDIQSETCSGNGCYLMRTWGANVLDDSSPLAAPGASPLDAPVDMNGNPLTIPEMAAVEAQLATEAPEPMEI